MYKIDISERTLHFKQPAVSTNHIVWNASHLLHHLAHLPKGDSIFRFGIATEIWERSTLTHSLYSRQFIRCKGEIITVSRGINAS